MSAQGHDSAAIGANSIRATAAGADDAAEADIGCPLHFAMARLAALAVQQHVLYEQGEYTPRPELLTELERWTRLHTLVARHVCPASRRTVPDPSRLEGALRDVPEPTRAHLRVMLARCAAHDGEDGCPLAAEPRARLLGDPGAPAGR